MIQMPISSLPTEVLEAYDGFPIPGWVRQFFSDAEKALEDVLFGDRPELHPNEPQLVPSIVSAAQTLRDSTDFVRTFDALLSAWIDTNFGHLPRASSQWSSRWTEAWVRAFDIVAAMPVLRLCGSTIRKVQPVARDHLEPLSKGRGSDPYWSFLVALARHQVDNLLKPFWYELCRLGPIGTPYFYGQVGLEGLRELPGRAAFPSEVAAGLVLLARALNAAAAAGVVTLRQSQREFRFLVRGYLRSFPFERRWRMELVDRLSDDGPEREWFNQVLPGIINGGQQKHSEPFWKPRVVQVEQLFDLGLKQRGLAGANALLLQQRQYAELTGNSERLVFSLCNFANRAVSVDASISLAWARAAFQWGRDNPYAWTTLSKAYVAAGFLDLAAANIWETTQRFPQNPVAWIILVQFLRMQSKDDSVDAAEEALAHLPSHVGLHTLKGVILGQSGRWSEAEISFRDALKYPSSETERSNVFTGLARALRRQSRTTEAELAYRQAIATQNAAAPAFLGLASLQVQLGKMLAAEETLRAGLLHLGQVSALDERLAGLLLAQDANFEPIAIVGSSERPQEEDAIAKSANHSQVLEQAPLDRGVSAEDFFADDASDWSNVGSTLESTIPYVIEDVHDSKQLRIAAEIASPAVLDGQNEDFGKPVDFEEVRNRILAQWPDSDSLWTPQRSAETAAVVSARMLRRRASRRGEPLDHEALERALALVTGDADAGPISARAVAERILLLEQADRRDEAYQVVEESAPLSGSAARWLAVGRLRQSYAQIEPLRFSDETAQELVAPFRIAASLHSSLQALPLLADFRTCRVMYDGQRLAERAEVASERLNRRLKVMSEHDEPAKDGGDAQFQTWWSSRVLDLLSAAGVTSSESLDQLEEDLVFRVGG